MSATIRSKLLLPAIVCVEAIWVTFYRIGFNNLWLDELYVLKTVNAPLYKAVLSSPGFHNSPPLYYAAINIWGALFGASDAILRIPSALATIGTTLLVYHIVVSISQRKLPACIAAHLFLFSAYIINYAHEARAYALYCFLTLLSSYLFFALYRNITTSRRKAFMWWYGIALWLLCMTHPYALFVALAHLVAYFLLLKNNVASRLIYFKVWLLVAIASLPAIIAMVLRSQSLNAVINSQIAPSGSILLRMLTIPLRFFIHDNYTPYRVGVYIFSAAIMVCVLLLIVRAIVSIYRANRNSTHLATEQSHRHLFYLVMVVVVCVVTCAPMVIASLGSSQKFLFPRYYIASFPLLIIVFATSLPARFRALSTIIIAVFLGVVMLPPAWREYHRVSHPQYEHIAAEIIRYAHPSDYFLFTDYTEYIAIEHYLEKLHAPALLRENLPLSSSCFDAYSDNHAQIARLNRLLAFDGHTGGGYDDMCQKRAAVHWSEPSANGEHAIHMGSRINLDDTQVIWLISSYDTGNVIAQALAERYKMIGTEAFHSVRAWRYAPNPQ